MNKVLLFLLLSAYIACQGLDQLQNMAAAHGTDLVTTVSFNRLRTHYVTGGNDNNVKVWALNSATPVHVKTYSDIITNVGLHPQTDFIFVLVGDGTISILDPTTFV